MRKKPTTPRVPYGNKLSLQEIRKLLRPLPPVPMIECPKHGPELFRHLDRRAWCLYAHLRDMRVREIIGRAFKCVNTR